MAFNGFGWMFRDLAVDEFAGGGEEGQQLRRHGPPGRVVRRAVLDGHIVLDRAIADETARGHAAHEQTFEPDAGGAQPREVDAAQREDWVADQVERGIDVLVTNPELVKTGLDLLEFPTIVFMQSGFNVYTLMQAARRSWRIGQKHPVKVVFLGYSGSSQVECLRLMAKKIAVTQSTSGDMPDCGLDVLNDAGDSIEVQLAKQLLANA